MDRPVETAGRLDPIVDSETPHVVALIAVRIVRAVSVRTRAAHARMGPAIRLAMAQPVGVPRRPKAARPTSGLSGNVRRSGAIAVPPISSRRISNRRISSLQETAPPIRLETLRLETLLLEHLPPDRPRRVAPLPARRRRSAGPLTIAPPVTGRILPLATDHRNRTSRSRALRRSVRRRSVRRKSVRRRAALRDALPTSVRRRQATDPAAIDPAETGQGVRRRASGRPVPVLGPRRRRKTRSTPTARRTWRSMTPRVPSCAA